MSSEAKHLNLSTSDYSKVERIYQIISNTNELNQIQINKIRRYFKNMGTHRQYYPVISAYLKEKDPTLKQSLKLYLVKLLEKIEKV